MKKLSLAMIKLLAIRLGYLKALHSHSAKSPKNGDISRWLTIAKSLVIILMIAPTFAHAWPWSMDMANQISIKPQESVDPANPGMNPFPKRSVPVPSTPTSSTEVKDKDAAFKLVNPVPVNARTVDMGQRLFSIYCVPCHGKSGTGDGLVGAKLILQPWNLTSSNDLHPWDSKDYPDGYIFGMMTFGGAIMPVYAIDLSPTERWEVVNYIRNVLQKKAPIAASVAQKKK
jgi:S-disulfanyl-L-cysteine oxidoreductase SoxD